MTSRYNYYFFVQISNKKYIKKWMDKSYIFSSNGIRLVTLYDNSNRLCGIRFESSKMTPACCIKTLEWLFKYLIHDFDDFGYKNIDYKLISDLSFLYMTINAYYDCHGTNLEEEFDSKRTIDYSEHNYANYCIFRKPKIDDQSIPEITEKSVPYSKEYLYESYAYKM